MRVLHLSDLHISPTVPQNRANAVRALPALRAAKPDLVVVTGDLVEHGHHDPSEFDAAKAFLDQLGCRWLALPGNHDVGNFIGAGEASEQITAERVEAFRGVFGADRFQHDRLIGVNAMLLGSGLAAEDEQWRWLERALASVAGSGAILFTHAPLFLKSPSEPQSAFEQYWCPPAEARDRLWRLCRSQGVKLIASGHVHQNRLTQVDSTQVAWATALSGLNVGGQGFPGDADHTPIARLFVMHEPGDAQHPAYGTFDIETIDLPIEMRHLTIDAA